MYTCLVHAYFLLLAPCQWAFHPDSHAYKLMADYGMIMEILVRWNTVRDHVKSSTSPKISFREVFSVTIPDLPTKYGARRSINSRVVSGQTDFTYILSITH